MKRHSITAAQKCSMTGSKLKQFRTEQKLQKRLFMKRWNVYHFTHMPPVYESAHSRCCCASAPEQPSFVPILQLHSVPFYEMLLL